MGAIAISEEFDGQLTKKEVEAELRALCFEDFDDWCNAYDCWDDFDGIYSGGWGTLPCSDIVVFHARMFKDREAAEAYCLDHAEKWGPAVAVRFRSGNTERWLAAGWAAC